MLLRITSGGFPPLAASLTTLEVTDDTRAASRGFRGFLPPVASLTALKVTDMCCFPLLLVACRL